MGNDDQLFSAMMGAIDATAHLSAVTDRLLALEIAWITLAQQGRNEALFRPGGFSEERTRHLEHLEKMRHLVASDMPDLELERLHQEQDFTGIQQRLQQRLANDPETIHQRCSEKHCRPAFLGELSARPDPGLFHRTHRWCRRMRLRWLREA